MKKNIDSINWEKKFTKKKNKLSRKDLTTTKNSTKPAWRKKNNNSFKKIRSAKRWDFLKIEIWRIKKSQKISESSNGFQKVITDTTKLVKKLGVTGSKN
jgi:hypothetical protein